MANLKNGPAATSRPGAASMEVLVVLSDSALNSTLTLTSEAPERVAAEHCQLKIQRYRSSLAFNSTSSTIPVSLITTSARGGGAGWRRLSHRCQCRQRCGHRSRALQTTASAHHFIHLHIHHPNAALCALGPSAPLARHVCRVGALLNVLRLPVLVRTHVQSVRTTK